MHKGLSTLLTIVIIVLVLALAGGGFYWYKTRGTTNPTGSSSPATTPSWQEGSIVIPGQFADADVVTLGAGKYRLYFANEPESGSNLEIYSATSTDGKTWVKEEGVRKAAAVFPDVLKISDNQYRMYFQNAGVIKSAVSTDGLSWQDEAGVRIDNQETGFNIDMVGAQTSTRLEDGTYAMVYRGTINEPYQSTEKLPNNTTQLFFWATSKDGLNFTKNGLALDSRNNTLLGAIDGADWINWDDGKLRLYFWSYGGVYHSVFDNNNFSVSVFDFTTNKDSAVKFSPNPPCDPTLININNQWFMYYGQHGQGIYYATLASS